MPPKRKSKKKKKTSAAESTPPAKDAAPVNPETLAESSESAGASSGTIFTASNSSVSSSPSSSSWGAGESSSSAALGDDGDGEERRDLAWLIDAFGASSIGRIESAYRLAGGDAFLAAGILGAEPQPPDPPPERQTQPLPPAAAAARRACRKQKKVAVVASGMVADVIGREYSRPAPIGGNKDTARDVVWYHAEEAKLEPHKYNREEAEQFLCSMLGDNSELGMGVVKDVLDQCEDDVEKALDALLYISGSISRHEKGSRTVMKGKDTASYRSCFPGHGFSNGVALQESKHSQFQLTDRVSFTSYDESENELLWEYYSRASSDDSSSSEVPQSPVSSSTKSKPDVTQRVLESLFNIPEVRTHDPSTMDWKKVVKKLRNARPEPSSVSTPVNDGKVSQGRTDGYHEFRDLPTMHYDTMRSYFQKAAVAYKKGDKAYASYLSEEGNHYRKLGIKADERASQEIFRARNKVIKNTITIDLHGQHVHPAMRLLKDNLLYCVKLPSVLLRVITGCGTEGPGKGKIKRAVVALADREGIPYTEENSGTIALRLSGAREFIFSQHGSDTEH